MRPRKRKIKAIEDFPRPSNVHEVRRFVGLASFFRRFVKNFAVIAKPLTDLTKENTPFLFDNSCVSAFVKLKQCLTNAPILKLFDPTAPTELHTDASAVGIAGLLLQKDESGRLRLVYCVSKKTSEAESKYHSSRLELLAIVWKG